MLRWISLVVLSAFCLVGVPVLAQAQVTNLVLNPSFEDESDIVDDQWIPDGWVTWGDADGLNSVVEFDDTEFIDGTRSVRVEPQGTENWHFMVIYYPVAQSTGTTYTASFWAKAEEPRPIWANIKATDNSVGVITTEFELTTEWEEYAFTYEAGAEPGAAEIKYEIWVSASEIPLWLDFVYVYEGVYVEGIMPSELATPIEPAGKLAARWGEIKSIDF